MRPLAFNTVVPQSLRWKPQFAIAVLPIGLMFASFGPLFFFAYWLERALGIPHNSPIKNHPNGILWLALLLSAMVVLVVLSYLLGWLANGLISRYVLGWPASKVVAVYMRSEVPQEWLKPSGTQASNRRKQDRKVKARNEP